MKLINWFKAANSLSFKVCAWLGLLAMVALILFSDFLDLWSVAAKIAVAIPAIFFATCSVRWWAKRVDL